jgi:phage replication O-like protein O
MIYSPNFTQIPNNYFDTIMGQLNGSENLIFLAIMRKTFGWNKSKDNISYTQLAKVTGISSYSTIKKAIDSLIDKKLIIADNNGIGKTMSYSVNVENSPENVENTNPYRKCNGTPTESVAVNHITPTESVDTKESNINKYFKETTTDEVDTSSDNVEKSTDTEHNTNDDITHTTASKQSCNKSKSEQEESRTIQIVRETYSEYRKRCPNMPECNITDSLCRCVIGTIRRYSVDKIRECLDTAGKSSWLNSHTTNFVCDFKWIFRNSAKGTPTNVDKILEGYYNRQTKGMAFQEGQQDYSDTTSWRNMDKPKVYDNESWKNTF